MKWRIQWALKYGRPNMLNFPNEGGKVLVAVEVLDGTNIGCSQAMGAATLEAGECVKISLSFGKARDQVVFVLQVDNGWVDGRVSMVFKVLKRFITASVLICLFV